MSKQYIGRDWMAEEDHPQLLRRAPARIAIFERGTPAPAGIRRRRAGCSAMPSADRGGPGPSPGTAVPAGDLLG